MYPFERFSGSAKKVLSLAQEESERAHHSYIGTEHLLLGLLREGQGRAAKALANLGVQTETVRTTIQSFLGVSEPVIVQQIIPTSRVKKVIGIAFEEAQRMNNTYVGTEHLLLGLLIEGEGIAAHVLEDLGANLEVVRQELTDLPVTEQDLGVAGPATPPRAPGESTRLSPGAAPSSRGWSGADPAHQRTSDGLNLTASAKSAVALCEEEALRSGTAVIDTGHLLLGLLRQGEGRAAVALHQLGVSLNSARQSATELRGAEAPVLAVGVLEGGGYRSALRSAAGQPRPEGGWVDTGHLLQGLLAVREGVGARLLQGFGVGPAQLTQALAALGSDGTPE